MYTTADSITINQNGESVTYEVGDEVSIEAISENTSISPAALLSKFAIIPMFTGVAVTATVLLTVELLELLWKR